VSGRRKRVLVGAFTIEANTFAPGETTLDDFRAQVWAVGADVRRDTLGPRSELAAAWSVLEDAGCELVPGLATWSAPRQPLTLDCLEQIVELACAPVDGTFDGAYMMLHGSAVAHGDDDPEGTLLSELRARLGPGKPIAISLDCHGNLTAAMLRAVDAIAVYRTCPHIDTDRTGAAAGRMLADALAGRARPVVAAASRPMVTPPQLHDNEAEPFASLMKLSAELEREDVLATGLLLVQPWIDVPALSWTAVATADGSVEAARLAADTLADAAWAARHGFMVGRRPSVDAAFEEALAGPAPFVFADSGDATNGGSIGDSTELLRAALRRGSDATVLLSVVAPPAVEAAHAAGVGARLSVPLGDGGHGAYNEGVELDVEVERLGDGKLVYTHPVNAGYRGSAGPAALLRHGPLRIVAHARSVGVIDPAIYVALGEDVRDYDVVQAKSHISYRTGFDPFTTRSVVADTAGPTTGNLALLDYRKRPRPLFPFELD
jgi:microcystin degradation protein MlrC